MVRMLSIVTGPSWLSTTFIMACAPARSFLYKKKKKLLFVLGFPYFFSPLFSSLLPTFPRFSSLHSPNSYIFAWKALYVRDTHFQLFSRHFLFSFFPAGNLKVKILRAVERKRARKFCESRTWPAFELRGEPVYKCGFASWSAYYNLEGRVKGEGEKEGREGREGRGEIGGERQRGEGWIKGKREKAIPSKIECWQKDLWLASFHR